jgi:hypothetical protein
MVAQLQPRRQFLKIAHFLIFTPNFSKNEITTSMDKDCSLVSLDTLFCRTN